MQKAEVLLLDDSKPVHERIVRAFRDSAVSVVATESLAEAQARVLSASRPDLVILDLEMPTLGGAMVGRAFKRRSQVPIVLFSSESPERLREARDYVGAEAALSKSASDTELVDTVLRIIAEARARQGSRP